MIDILHDESCNISFTLVTTTSKFIFTYIPCILILSKFFIHQQMHSWIVFKNNFKIHIKINIQNSSDVFRCSHTIVRKRITRAYESLVYFRTVQLTHTNKSNLTLVIPMRLSNSYKLQISVKHNNFFTQNILKATCFDPKSHHQAFQRRDPMYQNL
jgi:hypothetical protein